MGQNVIINSQDVDKYLDEQEKSFLSGIVWKIERLKAAENDPNQLKLSIVEDRLVSTGTQS